MNPIKFIQSAVLVPLVFVSSQGYPATPPALSNPGASPEAALGPLYYGGISGSATVSAGGNASYIIPIELPPGTRGMTPSVSLNYNSNMKNGLLGLGWFMQGLHQSKIARCPRNFAIDGAAVGVEYTANDRFCLDGHRLMVVDGGAYGDPGTEYRTENDNFSRIISYGTAGSGPAYFSVETKSGQTRYYGKTTDSRIEAEGRSDVRTWALNRVEDAVGNYYTVSYHEDNAEGEFYPTRMDFTGNDTQGLAPNAYLEFNYEARSDNHVKFVENSQWRPHPVRLKTLKTYVDSALVRSYTLSYAEVGYGDLSRLTRIDHCDAQGNCQAPTRLTWNSADGLPTYTYSTLTTPWYSAMQCNAANQNPHIGQPGRWHDMNGDGRPDYVHPKYKLNSSGYRLNQAWYQLSFDMKLSAPGGGYVDQVWSSSIGATMDLMLFGDVNGDGMTDIVYKDNRTRNHSLPKVDVALSTGSGFDNQLWNGDLSKNANLRYELADVNGDGLHDLIALRPLWNSAYADRHVYVRLSTGSSFAALTLRAANVSFASTFKDMNGDGRSDLLYGGKVRLSNSTGFDAPVSWGGDDYYSPYSDYNGDGLPDRLETNGAIYLNNGTGFESYASAGYTPVTDIDGDGLVDSYGRNTDDYTGKTKFDLWFNAGVSGSPGNLVWDFTKKRLFSNQLGRNLFQGLADLNGDGQLDYTVKSTVACYKPNQSGYWGAYWKEYPTMYTYQSNSGGPHLLKKVSSGPGVETQFTFKPISDSSVYTKGSGAIFPDKDIQDSTHVVSQLSQSDGRGGTFDSDYSYEGLRRNVQGRGNLGFARITRADLDKGTKSTTEYSQAFPHAMQPVKVETRRSSDNQLLSSEDITYNHMGTIGSGPVTAYVASKVTRQYDLGTAGHLSTSTTTNTVDSYGNITTTTTEIVDHENNQTSRVRVDSTFNIDVTNWRVGQLTQTLQKNWLDGINNSALDRTTQYSYHSSTGLLHTKVREPGGGTGIKLTNTLSYDGFGNILTETVSGPGLSSRTNTLTYDARGQFVTTRTNALGHQSSFTWDVDTGKKLSETDINGQTTSWAYNGFGQQTVETRPDGTTTATSVYRDNTAALTHSSFYAEAISTGKAPARKFFDQLGREIRSRTQGFTGYYVNIDTQYDSQGRANRKSEPFFDGDSVAWNTQTFDFLGRVTAVSAADPVNSSTTGYDAYEVAITDALGQTTTRSGNAMGQVIEVEDDAGTTMTMTYDPMGNRTRVTNAVGTPAQNSVTYSYDKLGRMLTQNDPDHGLYTYTYDALGQKLSDISPGMAAAAQSVTFQYDQLGRMTSRTEPEGTTSWTYDYTNSGNLGKGQLHTESQFGFTRKYYHAAGNYGRPTSTTTVIGASSYTSSQTYNSNGQVATQTYPGSYTSPGGYTIANTYNALGYLERVQEAGGAKVLYQLVDTDAAGRPTLEWKGDGSSTSLSYEGVSGRFTNQQTTNGAATVQHFTYTYNAAGSMTNRSDMVNNLSETFTFDNLDRLTSARVTGATAVNFAFDETGNITRKSDYGNPFQYTNSAAVHAVTQVVQGAATQTLSYDSNGNLAGGTDAPTANWASYNKPTQLNKGGVTYDFEYGPDRLRYKKTRGTEVTHYIGSGFEKITHSTSISYRHMIRANGKVIMMRKDSSAGGPPSHEYIHRDHLGSVTALTRESNGSIIERYSYDAWGQRRNATNWNALMTAPAYEQRGYTGHEHLDDIDVIHMNGRIYEPRLGRMLSPDPVTADPQSGQDYNRYTYAFNNPLMYSDPSGYNPELGGAGSGTTTTSAGAGVFRAVFRVELLHAGVEATAFQLWKELGGNPRYFPGAVNTDVMRGIIGDRAIPGDGRDEQGDPMVPNPIIGESPQDGDVRYVPVIFVEYEETVVGGTSGLLGPVFGALPGYAGILAGVAGTILDHDVIEIETVTYQGSQRQVFERSYTFEMITLENGDTVASPTSRGVWVNDGDPIPEVELERNGTTTIVVWGTDRKSRQSNAQ